MGVVYDLDIDRAVVVCGSYGLIELDKGVPIMFAAYRPERHAVVRNKRPSGLADIHFLFLHYSSISPASDGKIADILAVQCDVQGAVFVVDVGAVATHAYAFA